MEARTVTPKLTVPWLLAASGISAATLALMLKAQFPLALALGLVAGLRAASTD